jgi:hypothetical protein
MLLKVLLSLLLFLYLQVDRLRVPLDFFDSFYYFVFKNLLPIFDFFHSLWHVRAWERLVLLGAHHVQLGLDVRFLVFVQVR